VDQDIALDAEKWLYLAVEKYVKARNIIKEAGLRNADETLAHLDYK
jgi:hypothetical protein